MTGFLWILGDTDVGVESMAPELRWTGEERREAFRDGEVRAVDVHRPDDGDRPVETDDGALLWVWGTAFGHDDGDTYHRRPPDVSTTRFCADRYERAGTGFVSGLNGHFVGAILEPDDRTVSFFTDRLGTVDAYWARPTDGTLVVSSHLQAIQRWPGRRWSFDVDALAEFFTFTRSMGCLTPLQGAELVPPATVTTLDLDAMALDAETYWTPRYRPVDAPFSAFVDEFVDRFRAALRDRTAAAGEYGLLLSGGADSRLLLAALEDLEDVTAYHMATWMNEEARTAERVALTAGVDFEVLWRDDDFLGRELERTPGLSNFQGKFTQAHAESFLPRIRGEVDYLLDGLYADVLFGGWGIPRRTVSLGPLGTLELPLAGPAGSIEDYLDAWASPSPRYLRTDRSTRDLLAERIRPSRGGVDHHGVWLPSPVELVTWSHVYPQTNMGGGFQIRSIRQHLPYRNPLLDDRLLDLSLSMPIEYHVRRDVVAAAVERLAPELAAIPHPDTGVPLSARYPLDWAREQANALRRKLGGRETPPRPDLGQGPWDDYAEAIRTRDIVDRTLARHEDTIRALPFLDLSEARACLREHRRGADNTKALLTLVTFLEMPVTRRVAATAAREPPDRR